MVQGLVPPGRGSTAVTLGHQLAVGFLGGYFEQPDLGPAILGQAVLGFEAVPVQVVSTVDCDSAPRGRVGQAAAVRLGLAALVLPARLTVGRGLEPGLALEEVTGPTVAALTIVQGSPDSQGLPLEGQVAAEAIVGLKGSWTQLLLQLPGRARE